VRQPLPAVGGRDAETLEEVRQYAPQAFRLQKRAVTEEDYATKAGIYPDREHPQVQRAAATRRWTGSWYTMFVTADRFDDQPVDEDFENGLRDHLEDFRLTGHDLEVNAPLFVPLEIRMGVCVEPGYFASDVKKRLLEVFGNRVSASGEKGFFHPDNFTFGQPVYLSKVIATAMSVDGVRWVELPAGSEDYCFKRWRKDAADEIDEGLIAMGRLEIAQLDNDPSRPENGLIEFIMD
jgi:predicted phage baseplate assembly protein